MDTPVAEIDFFSFFIMNRVVLGWGVLLSLLTRQQTLIPRSLADI